MTGSQVSHPQFKLVWSRSHWSFSHGCPFVTYFAHVVAVFRDFKFKVKVIWANVHNEDNWVMLASDQVLMVTPWHCQTWEHHGMVIPRHWCLLYTALYTIDHCTPLPHPSSQCVFSSTYCQHMQYNTIVMTHFCVNWAVFVNLTTLSSFDIPSQLSTEQSLENNSC